MNGYKLLPFLALALFICAGIGCGEPPTYAEQPADYDAVVIGAGMGGLSAGAHLASNGLKVLVLEQHHKVGGCTSSFSRGDFNFDISLHEMAGGGEGTEIGNLLKLAGVADKVEMIRIEDLYRTIGPGINFKYPGNIDEAVRTLSEKWPEEAEDIAHFHELMGKIHRQAMEIGGLYRKGPLGKAFTYLLTPIRQPTLVRYLRSDVQDILDKYFEDEALKLVLSQLWVFYGPPPSRLWSVIFMSANYTYLNEGAWHVKGSSQALSDAYAERITEMGGTVRTGTLVTDILVEDGRARGVKTAFGEIFTSRYVVSNADPFQTFFKLVGEEKTPKKYAKRIRSMEPSNAVISVYIGLDVEPSFWNATDHAVFYTTTLDPEKMYENMMKGRYDEACCMLTFYTNLGDPWYAPPGKSALVLAAFSDIKNWSKDRETYRAQKQRAADQLLGLAEKVYPGLRDHIEVLEVATPVAFEQYTMQKNGIPYGWNFTPKQGLRLTNDTPVEGLYLAGSWTNPGHGVGTAQISGYQAARLILDREGID